MRHIYHLVVDKDYAKYSNYPVEFHWTRERGVEYSTDEQPGGMRVWQVALSCIMCKRDLEHLSLRDKRDG